METYIYCNSNPLTHKLHLPSREASRRLAARPGVIVVFRPVVRWFGAGRHHVVAEHIADILMCYNLLTALYNSIHQHL